jgi:hypothetical protein
MNNKYNPQKKIKYKKVEALYKDGVPISRIETLTGITRKTIRIWLTASGQYKPSHNNNINRYYNNKGKSQPKQPESPQTLPQATKSHAIGKEQPSTPQSTPDPTDISPIYKDIYKDIDIIGEDIEVDTDNTDVNIDNHKETDKLSDITTTKHLSNLDTIITKILKRLKNNTVIADMTALQLTKALDITVSKRVQLERGNNTQQEASTFILQFINNRNFTGELKEIGQVKQKTITVKACE